MLTESVSSSNFAVMSQHGTSAVVEQMDKNQGSELVNTFGLAYYHITNHTFGEISNVKLYKLCLHKEHSYYHCVLLSS